MDLEKTIAEEVKKITDSGFIQEKIKETLEKCLQSVIMDCLCNYSDFGKNLKEKVKASLALADLDLDFTIYNQLICNYVKEIIDKNIISDAKEQIKKDLEKFFIPITKTEYKISEIIEEFKKGIGCDPGESGEISFHKKESTTSDGYIDYRFDEESDRDYYSCSYELRINKTGLWYMEIEGKDVNKIKTDKFYGFDSFLFQLYARKIKIIDDSDNVELEYGYYED